MRHEVAAARLQRGGLATGLLTTALAPAARAGSVGHAADAAALVAARCFSLRVHSRRARTAAAAVTLTTIAAAAQQHLRAATRAHQQTGGMVDHARLLGKTPEDAGAQRCNGLDEAVRQCNTGVASASQARCRVRRGSRCQARRRRRARLPLGTRRRFYRTGRAHWYSPTEQSCRRPQCRPAGRHCGRSRVINDPDDQARKCCRLAAAGRKRHFTTASPKRSLTAE